MMNIKKSTLPSDKEADSKSPNNIFKGFLQKQSLFRTKSKPSLNTKIAKKDSAGINGLFSGYMSHDESSKPKDSRRLKRTSKDDFYVHKNFGREEEIRKLEKRGAIREGLSAEAIGETQAKKNKQKSKDYPAFAFENKDRHDRLLGNSQFLENPHVFSGKNGSKNSHLSDNTHQMSRLVDIRDENPNSNTLRVKSTEEPRLKFMESSRTLNKPHNGPDSESGSDIKFVALDVSQPRKTPESLSDASGLIEYDPTMEIHRNASISLYNQGLSDGVDGGKGYTMRKESGVHPLMAIHKASILDYDLLSELSLDDEDSHDHAKKFGDDFEKEHFLNKEHRSPSYKKAASNSETEYLQKPKKSFDFRDFSIESDFPAYKGRSKDISNSMEDGGEYLLSLPNTKPKHIPTTAKWILTIIGISLLIFMAGICLKYINYKNLLHFTYKQNVAEKFAPFIENLSNLDILNNFQSYMTPEFNVEIGSNGEIHSTGMLGRFFVTEIVSFDGYFIKIVFVLFICISSVASGAYNDYFGLREALLIGILFSSTGILLSLLNVRLSRMLWIIQSALIGTGYGIIFSSSIIAFYNYYRSKTFLMILEKNMLKTRKAYLSYMAQKRRTKNVNRQVLMKAKPTKSTDLIEPQDLMSGVRNSGSRLSLYLLIPLLSQVVSILIIKAYIYQNEEDDYNLSLIPKIVGPCLLVLGSILAIFFTYRYDLLDETTRNVSTLPKNLKFAKVVQSEDVEPTPKFRGLRVENSDKEMKNKILIQSLETAHNRNSLTDQLELQNAVYKDIETKGGKSHEMMRNYKSGKNATEKSHSKPAPKSKFSLYLSRRVEEVTSLSFFKKRTISEKFEIKIQLKLFFLTIFFTCFGIMAPFQYVEFYAISSGISEVDSSQIGLWCIYFSIFGLMLGSIFAIIKRRTIEEKVTSSELKNAARRVSRKNITTKSLAQQLSVDSEYGLLYRSVVLKTFLISTTICGIAILLLGLLEPTFIGIFLATMVYGTSLGHIIMSILVILYELSVVQYSGISFGIMVVVSMIPMMIAIFTFNSILNPKLTYIIPNYANGRSIPLSEVGKPNALPTIHLEIADNAFRTIFIIAGSVVIFSVIFAMLTFVISLKQKKSSKKVPREINNC